MVDLDRSGGTIALLRTVGLREIASGVGILTQANPSNWLWARVGGDTMDLALLTKAMGSDNSHRGRIATATAAVVGVTAADALASMQEQHHREHNAFANGVAPVHAAETRVASAITVNAPIDEVFAAWNGFQTLPQFMRDFAAVQVMNDRQSHWQAMLPGGMTLGWDVTITDTAPNERIAWRSDDGSRLEASGEVRFRPAPGGRGTEILFEARIRTPGGELGNKIAGLFSDALGQKVQNDLRRAKQLIELGEIVKSDDSIVNGPNPAQPVGKTTAV